MKKQISIRELAVISDRRTCALIGADGGVHWYCPKKFDAPAILSSLIDIENGGRWSLKGIDMKGLGRQFCERSSILESYFSVNGHGFTITDFMPLEAGFSGICRKISASPVKFAQEIMVRPDYGLSSVTLERLSDNCIKIVESGLWLSCSHPLKFENDKISLEIPQEEESWACLVDQPILKSADVDEALAITLKNWRKLESLVDYHGPFENQVRDSLRALQQMVYEPTGGIIAASTTSLPEVIGGRRNYDYRYVWIRDAALITSSLTQLISTGELERKFVSFISGAMIKNEQTHVSCFYNIDQTKHSGAHEIALPGYLDSRPVLIGNDAADQFQLDAEANILIAWSLIYEKTETRINWDTVNQIADFICKNWERKDNGIWEEEQLQHYTSSKAFAARGLELLAPYQEDSEIADRWLENARLIREFISEKCMTSKGAYAVHAGSQDVDISAALYAPFGFDDAGSESMQATVREIERGYADGHLYRRTLLEFDSTGERAFLASSCWMAHYYAIAGNVDKCKQILDTVLEFSNELGYFSEEAEVLTGQMLGNFPQTFVHSSFICAANGYKSALSGKNSVVRSKTEKA